MKEIHKTAIGAGLVFVSIFVIYSCFHVRGSAIRGVSAISPAASVTISKGYLLDADNHRCVLSAEQIETLKALISDSTFTRRLVSSVRFYDKDLYEIKIDFNNGQDVLHIHGIGNEYISIPDQFGGKHLKINNPAWKATLEQILVDQEVDG